MFHYGPIGQSIAPAPHPHIADGVAHMMYYVILAAALVALIVVFFVVRKKGQ